LGGDRSRDRHVDSPAMKLLAASTEVMPLSASSFTSRSCKVRKARSERPRASGA
jgi:hypothetical protein